MPPSIDFDEITAAALAERPDAQAIKTALLRRLPDFIRMLLGKPNPRHSSQREWRYGQNGSLAVVMAGAKSGLWHDHESADGGDVFALIMRETGCAFPEALDRAAEFLGGALAGFVETSEPVILLAPDPAASQRAEQIWIESIDPRGTVVEAYLAGRGLNLSDTVADEVLRFHPKLWCDGEILPAMVALVRDIRTDDPKAIHRTFLTADANRVAKKMLGPVKGGAIKLSPDEDVTTGLTVGEGIETCMSAPLLGFSPVWALGSAGAIADFRPEMIPIESLTILIETDDSGANRRAAEKCRDRWLAARREVIFAAPTFSGDMNDALRRAAAA